MGIDGAHADESAVGPEFAQHLLGWVPHHRQFVLPEHTADRNQLGIYSSPASSLITGRELEMTVRRISSGRLRRRFQGGRSTADEDSFTRFYDARG